jgi:DNA-binding NtrC family response regulator
MNTNILVVDDEEIIRQVVRLYLEREGYTVIEAVDGLEALAILEKESVGLVLCDIRMPRLDGLSFLKSLKEKGIHTPVIMISGYLDTELTDELMSQGALDYLTKPIQRDRLLLAIKRGLEFKIFDDTRSRP